MGGARLVRSVAAAEEIPATAGTVFECARTPPPVRLRAMWWVTVRKFGAGGSRRLLADDGEAPTG
jgi:hypothetical protein